VNTLASYVTALITMRKRLVYLSSGMHYGAGSHFDDMLWEKRRWNSSQAFAETKFHDVLLAVAVARMFPTVRSNSLEPGWVSTKMGGADAPDDIDKAHGARSGSRRVTNRLRRFRGNISISAGKVKVERAHY